MLGTRRFPGIEAAHRERTSAFCYCTVGSSLGIAEATDEYHALVYVMATPTAADTLADQLNHERLGLSRQQAETIIGQSWARFPRISEPSLVIIDCVRNGEGTHFARPALGQLVTAALLNKSCSNRPSSEAPPGHAGFRAGHCRSPNSAPSNSWPQ